MEFGERRYLKLLEKYTYTLHQSSLSMSTVAKAVEFPDLEGVGPWPARAKEKLQERIIERLREMDSRGEMIPGETEEVSINNPDDPSEYQAFLRSNQDTAAAALMIASKHAMAESESHKAWVIDQIVRALTGSQYEAFINHSCQRNSKENGAWDEGSVP